MACVKETDATVPTCPSDTSSSIHRTASNSSRSCSESPEQINLKRLAESDSNEMIIGSHTKKAKESVSGESEGSQSSEYIISSSSQRSESSCSVPIDNIPGVTTEWTEYNLSQLNVVIGSTPVPELVLSGGYTEFLKNDPNHTVPEIIQVLKGSRNRNRENILQAKFDCCQYVCSSVISIDSEFLQDIPVQQIQHLNIECSKPFRETSLYKWQEAYLVGKSEKMKNYITDLCRSILVRVEDFCYQLLHMVQLLHRDGSGDVTEGMYQGLFMSFVRIFDLKIVGFSNVQQCNFSVFGEKTVKSRPDAIICKVDPSSLEEKVIAVVEVKKKYSKSEDNVSLQTLRGSEKKIDVVDHIDSNLKGQHVGEMLAFLPMSVFGLNGIYGIVVQATEVTFGSMVVGKEYYKQLTERSVPKSSSSVQYSKPYNFLLVKGRENLIETFLEMGTLLDHILS